MKNANFYKILALLRVTNLERNETNNAESWEAFRMKQFNVFQNRF